MGTENWHTPRRNRALCGCALWSRTIVHQCASMLLYRYAVTEPLPAAGVGHLFQAREQISEPSFEMPVKEPCCGTSLRRSFVTDHLSENWEFCARSGRPQVSTAWTCYRSGGAFRRSHPMRICRTLLLFGSAVMPRNHGCLCSKRPSELLAPRSL